VDKNEKMLYSDKCDNMICNIWFTNHIFLL
jgi:hypothetical protein